MKKILITVNVVEINYKKYILKSYIKFYFIRNYDNDIHYICYLRFCESNDKYGSKYGINGKENQNSGRRIGEKR